MASIQLAADASTLVINGRAIADLVSGDILTLTPVNPRTSHVNGTNGGVNINERSDAGVYDLTVRVMMYSEDDVFLNTQRQSSPPTVVQASINTSFTRDGVDGAEAWILENGSHTTQPTKTVNDQDGNALVEYTIRFRSCTRSL